jgi:hypothetical protein
MPCLEPVTDLAALLRRRIPGCLRITPGAVSFRMYRLSKRDRPSSVPKALRCASTTLTPTYGFFNRMPGM